MEIHRKIAPERAAHAQRREKAPLRRFVSFGYSYYPKSTKRPQEAKNGLVVDVKKPRDPSQGIRKAPIFSGLFV